MLLLAVAALLAAATPAMAITSNCFFNVSMQDTSPLIRYNPPSAFRTIFVNSPASTWQPGIIGQGISTHSTYGLEPYIIVEFPGTVAWAKGGVANVSNTPIRFTIDDRQQPYPVVDENVFLSTSTDLAMGPHTARLQIDPSSTDPLAWMALFVFQTLTGVAAESNDPEKVNCHVVEFAKHLTNNQVIMHGNNWEPHQTYGGVGGQPQFDYSSIISNNTASVSLYPPKGSNYFYLNGTVGNAYGLYTVLIDPAPPYPRNDNTFNASNSWDVLGELLYFTPLDPDVEYKITVTGDEDVNKYLGLNSWMYCDYSLNGNKPNGTTPTRPDKSGTDVPSNEKKTNVGAIAGGVVGGVAAAAAIGALIFFLCRRNRKKDNMDADPAMFTVDDTVDATTPYRAPSTSGTKLAQNEQAYGGYPQYGQTLYQEPNMAETGYGVGAAPLLAHYGSDGQQSRHTSMQSGGPFGDSRQGSGPWPGSENSYPLGSDGRQSFSAASPGMGMAGYASPGSGYGSSSHGGYMTGPSASEKSVPAHQRMHRVEHEQDAGGLPMPPEDVERLPPSYNPHWLDVRSSQPGASTASASPVPPPVGDGKHSVPTPQTSMSSDTGYPSAAGSSQHGMPGMFHPPVEKR
ncbi:hypothetical protein CC85DRAFT_310712 [Cutaneotrichosporon oleaginosum]|uniref:Mid2 domain-containing protein n=1 Tax=Cutaneotrichosporon oleaginosum TaxID=879819 RepID=A0A0J0XW45_9TREE|nr:uncharacterized protein CC85DRAFT_310712 [Cutaneotrichosporon oleaginosum]KLT45312.1 hypothetical protein CC85DRAFT_310712 [Cutaneotrichosporon oleaginosum]TXT14859.1 hypothetical protein COLE_01052 [Cutaneotrichosporon oleaginosum]